MLMMRFGQRATKLGRDDLHVAREHDDVRAPVEELGEPRLRLRADVARVRDVLERDAERLHRGAQVRVVRHDERDVAAEVAALPRPEELHHRVVVLRHQDRDPLALGGDRQPPVHREGARHVERERALEVLERQVEAIGLELEAREVQRPRPRRCADRSR